MSIAFECVRDGLYRIQSTCNTYLIVRGDTAIAIDPGNGDWLTRLNEIGVRQLEWVILTHTHRDQCAGVYRLDRASTQLAVPALEQHLVDDVESFWRRRQVFHNYNQVADFFSLPRNTPVDRALMDHETFSWQDVELKILPAPGHTPGSIALISEIRGSVVAFVGDLLESPGRVPQIHNLQYAYGDAIGAELTAHSVHWLLEHQPTTLCPGHGPLITEPEEAANSLLERLELFRRELYHSADLSLDRNFLEVSPHLLQSTSSSCSWHVVRSDDGHALLIDLGYQTDSHGLQSSLGYNTRFFPTRLHALLRNHGIQQIDAVLITHYHDDHVVGVPYLQRRWATQAWCLDRLAPILRDPAKYNMPCLLHQPIQVDRTFSDTERFEWRGVSFQMHDLPGQTDLHSGISFELDGHRYLAMGDSAHLRDGRLCHGHVIFANRVTAANHLKVAARMLEISPDILLHGHHRRTVLPDPSGPPQGRADTPVTHQDLVDFQQSAARLAKVMTDLVVDHPDRRCRADWVRVEPYRVFVAPGETVNVKLIAENLVHRPVTLSMQFVVPPGVRVEPETVSCELLNGQVHSSTHSVHMEHVSYRSPVIVCVDVVLNDERMGWLAECQLWSDGTPS